ncbi:hypothetical protein C8Q70DRAFT_939714 [Cubamyces menziesii]|nr:hypothetical protein C8Q70DRAFT_939714 [Cubamyces menziesii]
MSNEIELDDLSKRSSHPTTQLPGKALPEDVDVLSPKDDGVITAWTWASAMILLVLAVPLILSPRLLLFLSETGNERRAALTPLESFMALHTGLLLFALSLALIFNIPPDDMEVTTTGQGRGHPLLGPLSGACALISFIAYNTSSVMLRGRGLYRYSFPAPRICRARREQTNEPHDSYSETRRRLPCRRSCGRKSRESVTRITRCPWP